MSTAVKPVEEQRRIRLDFGSICVQIRPGAAREIASRISEETVDGVLIGRRLRESKLVVEVDLFLPVNARYWTESGSLDDPENQLAFQRTLSRFQRAEGNSSGVVGYFRADSGRPPRSGQLERDFMREYFREAQDIFLSIGAYRGEPAFSLAVLRGGELVEHSANAPKGTGRPGWLLPLAAAAGLLIAVAAGATYYRSRPATAAPVAAVPVAAAPQSTLDVRVERAGPDLRVTWPRDATAGVPNPQALLSIIDGGVARQIVITPQLLASGNLVYSANSGDVLFLLDIIVNGERKLSGSTRYVTFGDPAQATAPLPVTAVAPVQQRPAPAPAPPAESVQPAGSRSRTAARTFIPPRSVQSAPASRPEILDPPQIAALRPGLANAASEALKEITQLRAASPPPVSPAPVSPPAAAPVHGGSSDVLLPQVLREARIIIPADVRAYMTKDVEIHVKAFVDKTGRVYKTETLTPADNFLMLRLTSAAQDASKKWMFSPARRNGEALPSEMILRYKIVRGQ